MSAAGVSSPLVCGDPGTRECGIAVFLLRRLHTAWLGDGASVILPEGFGEPLILVERPEYQGARTDKARTQDTMALCWAGAKFAYYLAGMTGGQVKEITPTQWKGQMPKAVAHLRLWEVLSPKERALLGGAKTQAAILKAVAKGAAKRWPPGYNPYPKSFTTHNVLDAVAMGCVELGRLVLK